MASNDINMEIREEICKEKVNYFNEKHIINAANEWKVFFDKLN